MPGGDRKSAGGIIRVRPNVPWSLMRLYVYIQGSLCSNHTSRPGWRRMLRNGSRLFTAFMAGRDRNEGMARTRIQGPGQMEAQPKVEGMARTRSEDQSKVRAKWRPSPRCRGELSRRRKAGGAKAKAGPAPGGTYRAPLTSKITTELSVLVRVSSRCVCGLK